MKLTGLLASCALAAAVSLTALPAAAEDIPPQKVVYHNNGSSEPDYYKHFLGNIRNHINAVGRDNIELVVVDQSDGGSTSTGGGSSSGSTGRVPGSRGPGVDALDGETVYYRDQRGLVSQDTTRPGTTSLPSFRKRRGEWP